MEILETIDNGQTDVEIASVGKFLGTDPKTKQPITQNITIESLKKLEAEAQDQEYLIDKQHGTFKSGDARDESACGWLSNLRVIGDKLIGTAKWTSQGLELVKNRIFRFISPAFDLDENNTPKHLINCGLVNYPGIYSLGAIINSSPFPSIPEDNTPPHLEEHDDLTIEQNNNKDILTMNKDDLKKLIDDCVAEKLATLNEKPEEKVEEKPAEVRNEETKVEKPEEKVEEVISREVLNSAPLTKLVDNEPWRKLHGKAFLDWYSKHPYGV